MLTKFIIDDKFWGGYQKLIRESVIPYQEKALKDEIPGVEKSHAVENFKIAAGLSEGEFYGCVFQDSDLAKWIEAAAYALILQPDKKLEADIDEAIGYIEGAQDENGYLNTYFTLVKPNNRWDNLQEGHELYCSGHMMEAAVAYYKATGKTRLLDVMKKNADHIASVFGKNKRRGFPGHPEIELALVKLAEATGEKKYLELAKYFIDERGTEPNFFGEEKEKRGWSVWNADPEDRAYTQNSMPLRQQSVAEGHAVRAAYLYAGMADVARETDDKELLAACERIWENVTGKQMYITGGIGTVNDGEAFTVDYDLPNDTVYAESCAAIALMFFAQRMLKIEKNGKYGDEMERALYNCVLSGMSLDGTRFFYVNPLEVNPDYSGKITGHKHVLPQRPGWYGCACCPPNIARTIASLSDYAWLEEGKNLYSNLFVGGMLDLGDIQIKTETGYPYDGAVKYTVTGGGREMALALRIPSWSDRFELTLNGEKAAYTLRHGFAYIDKDFTAGDVVELRLDMSPKKVYSNVLVRENSAGCAIQKGPLVYCLEGIDNGGELRTLRVKRGGVIREEASQELGGTVKLKIDGLRMKSGGGLYSFRRPEGEDCTLTAIPYHLWCNRGLNQMTVWVKEN